MNISQIILEAGQSLNLTGASAVHATVHYADYSPSGAITPGSQLTVLTGSTSTIIAAAPATGYRRIIKGLSICNRTGGSVADIQLTILAASVAYSLEVFTLADKVSEGF